MPIAVLLSGGVDSSVALHRLLRGEVADLGPVAPSDLVACYLKIWLEDELAYLGDCPWEDDLSYAREVCRKAGVALEVVSLQRSYRQLVIDDALDELRAGRTPSPDILCNRRVKFGAFQDRLEEIGSFEFIASGHYARVRHPGRPSFAGDGASTGQGASAEQNAASHLLRGVDAVKDQTYFLHRLEQRQLRRLLFPLGELHKSEVRKLADDIGLPNRSRPDSQGLCFLGRVDFGDFVRAHLGERPGVIRELDGGRELGEHRGHWFYTIGQRKGLGLGGGPWYVVAKDVASDTLWVRHGERLEHSKTDRLRATALHWIAEPFAGGEVDVRLRHGPRLVPASCGVAGSELEVQLTEPDSGVAPGQALVIYDGEVCLGGGWIL